MTSEKKVTPARGHPPRSVDYANPTPAEQIRALLNRTGLSQRQAAHELGIDDRTMRYWCSGSRPPPHMAILALERLVHIQHSITELVHHVSKLAEPVIRAATATVLYLRSPEEGQKSDKPRGPREGWGHQVLIDGDDIAVEYEEDSGRRIHYIGRQVSPGHWELKAKEIADSRATLHSTGGPDSPLEGWWWEGDWEGAWRLTFD